MLKESTRCPAAHSFGTEWPRQFPSFPLSAIPTWDLILKLLLRINPQTTLDAFATHTAVKSFKPGLNIWLCSGIFQQMHFVKSLHWTEEPNFRQPQYSELHCFDCSQLYSFLFLSKTNQMLVSLFCHLFTSQWRLELKAYLRKKYLRTQAKQQGGTCLDLQSMAREPVWPNKKQSQVFSTTKIPLAQASPKAPGHQLLSLKLQSKEKKSPTVFWPMKLAVKVQKNSVF